ncbi:lipoprotein [Mycoplasmopsis californica]|uniref:Lipoprotein n=2 Tax=Mycoplasmopsis californica TaxID=2113 RepID=A0A059XQJ8_9BACT|nr:hypothetical protein [Mycoplasmopsis californica]AIA29280.1 lipoprotein [Mycoplasmopsis californica]
MKSKLKLLTLSTLGFFASALPLSCSVLKKEKIETLRIDAKLFGYVDFLKFNKNKFETVIIDNDLKASDITNNFLIYKNFQTVEDADDVHFEGLKTIKLSSVFDEQFFEENFLVYVAGTWSHFNSSNNILKQRIALGLKNNQKSIKLQHETAVNISPNVQVNPQASAYLINSLKSQYIIFKKKQYPRVIEWLKNSTPVDDWRINE